MKTEQISITEGSEVFFRNHVDYCVGTGRMGLALQQEYQEQLALVQKEIRFSFIRGHGLFHEDMGIYQEYTDEAGVKHAEYNFTYLDLVMDAYQRLHIRPFLELGFMPKKIASGEQAVFYWQGNTTPPKNYDDWCKLVQVTLKHLINRYGAEEVTGWPIEVWNEPNLPGFWENADMQEYFKLFDRTFHAVKEVDARFRIGGPAVCGVQDALWIRSFLEFCQSKEIRIDFITRHHYTTELPEHVGHYGYPKLSQPEDGYINLRSTRDIVDSFPEYKDLEIHITEFNTSYIPNCPLHDTNQNAAYMAGQLSRLGDVNESYSYWTFGDIFEEFGVPYTPFHGGFGLVANGCIPKPTFWTFKFYKKLQGDCVHKSEHTVVVHRPDGSYRGLVWNCPVGEEGEELTIHFSFPQAASENVRKEETEKAEKYVLVEQIVDEETCNPLKIWHDLGEPSSLTKDQKKLLQDSAMPLVKSSQIMTRDGAIAFEIPVKVFGMTYFELQPVFTNGDRGYRYDFRY
jgi:xylan 1,4-beta-xylosidase